MRVLVNRPAGKSRGEDGAVAIMVAVLAVVLVGIVAFTADFGMAYTSKRQLQTASDSAALAAAGVYASAPIRGECNELEDDDLLESTADQVAKDHMSKNHDESAAAGPIDVECVTNGSGASQLDVTFRSTADTPVLFGGVFSDDDVITTTRSATASVSVAPPIARAIRPYAICSGALPDGPLPSGVVRVDLPGNGGKSEHCPSAKTPGNWWTVHCPDGATGNSAFADAVLNGCENPVSIVPDQPSDEDDLNDYLVDACSEADAACLDDDTGSDLQSAGVLQAWKHLTDTQKNIILPVFCGEPDCNPAAVEKISGNTIYPVYRFAAVTVCGYHWGKKSGEYGQNFNGTGACSDNPNGFDASEGDNNDHYMLLAFTQVQVSGSTEESTCAIGDEECDMGLRQVLLTK